jgi:hypothetical protein
MAEAMVRDALRAYTPDEIPEDARESLQGDSGQTSP